MDRQSVYTTSIFPESEADESSKRRIQQQLQSFILEFQVASSFKYRYSLISRAWGHSYSPMCRDQIRENVLLDQYYCEIDIADLIAYDEQLAHDLNIEPGDVIPLVR